MQGRHGIRSWRASRSRTGKALLLAALGFSSPRAQIAAIRSAIDSSEALGVGTGVVVLDTRARRLVHAHRAREAFLPASNQKVVTAVAALARLGADHRFSTRFSYQNGVLEVHADGDPNWRSGSTYDPRVVFASVAAELARRGVRSVRDVRLAPGSFGPTARPAGWPADQFHLPYCAPSAAHVLNASCLSVRVDAGRRDAGGNAWVEIVAPPIDAGWDGGIARTRDKKRGGRFGFALRDGKVHLWGAALIGAPAREERIAIAQPTVLYRNALVSALRDQGITLSADGAAVGDVTFASRHHSPLRAALRPMLVSSSNFHAEQILRHLGLRERSSGSFLAGAAVVREVVEELVPGIDERVVIADGSGLSRANRITPRALALLLEAAASRSSAELRQPAEPDRKERLQALFDLLPQPGQGSIAGRFTKAERRELAGRVRAKSGWIGGVSSLSGFVGRTKVFAILMNYDRSRHGLNRKLKRIQERIVMGIHRIEP